MLLNNQWITEETKKGNLKIHRGKWQWKKDNPKTTGHSKRNSKTEVYSTHSYSKKKIPRKIWNKQLNLTVKATKKRGTNKTQSPKLVERKKP